MGILGAIGKVIGVAAGVPVHTPFKVRASITTETFGEMRLKVFVVEMTGSIRAPYDGYRTALSLLVVDGTGGKKSPIISAIEELQVADTIALGFNSKMDVRYRMSTFPNWVPVVKIPIDALTFPRSGARQIEFLLNIAGTDACATTTVSYTCTDPGYLDENENREKFELLAAELAFAVSASDGDVDHKEAAVIKEWIRKRVDMANPSDRERIKGRLNKTIASAVDKFNTGGKQDIPSLCSELKKVSTTAERYEALELGLRVAEADGVAEKGELEILDKLAHLLDVDKEQFRSMKDKHLTISMMATPEEVDEDSLLGLHTGMTSEEKKKHLRQEFQKWNHLAEHKDADRRQQAKEMLDLIGKKRAELV